jgi:DeoR family fructose operon transcriptional repressor
MRNLTGTIAAEERLRWLSERLVADGAVTIASAAEELAVSEMTIRRDLDELEDRGSARRVRGGARAIGPQPFAQRHQTAARAKGRIADKLAPLVPVAGVVAFDASSTVLRLTGALGAACDLTVVTNGPETFNALHGLAGIHPLLTGGRLEERTGSLVGPLAWRSASQLTVRTFFASASAVSPRNGGLETTLDEAEVKRVIAAAAEQVVLAVDASKLGGQGVAVGIEWECVDVLVTELDPGDQRLDDYRRLVRLL